jgi:hypothetical protein
MEAGGDTFENLCAYLGLPNSYHELVSSAPVFDLSVKWAQHEKVRIRFGIKVNACTVVLVFRTALAVRLHLAQSVFQRLVTE